MERIKEIGGVLLIVFMVALMSYGVYMMVDYFKRPVRVIELNNVEAVINVNGGGYIVTGRCFTQYYDDDSTYVFTRDTLFFDKPISQDSANKFLGIDLNIK